MGTEHQKTTTIHIAILAEEPISWGSGKHYFLEILNNYHWIKDGIKYIFKAELIYDRTVLQGKLTTKNYDVLLAPGGGVGDGLAIMKGFTFLRSVRKWKNYIKNFIISGGGYIGICGGTALITGLKIGKQKYETFTEKQYQKSSLNISCVNSYYKDLALPLFYLNQAKHPEKIGATGYVFSFAPGKTTDGKNIFSGGTPIDFQIDTSHPIFSDFSDPQVRIRWWGGPALVTPKKPNRKLSVIARYPINEISNNPDTQVHAWSYTGNIIGLIKAFFRASFLIKKTSDVLSNLFLFTYYLAGPWKRSSKIIDLDFSNKPSITAEEYPNEKKGRILLCTSHPEYMVWWGGNIAEMSETSDRCLATGLHQWKDITSLSKNMEKEVMYTWWIVRRFVAWAAKIQDTHMPPIELKAVSGNLDTLISENIYDGKLITQMKNI
jgi:hypothetical protein